MPLRAPGQTAASGDDGFSLVEAVVALAIATAIFTALAFALVGAAKASLLSQQNQQAGDVLSQAVEQARALSYEALVMRPADLNTGEPSGATRTPPIGSCNCYNPTDDTTAGTGVEPLVVPDPNGGLVTHVTSQLQNGGTFKIRRYVTVPADASGAVYKRLTVIVEWSTLGKPRSRTYSTLVAATKRGLPLPDFKFTNASSLGQCRNPGSDAVYTFGLKNNGARDAWNLSSSSATPGSWTYYADTNANGIFDSPGDVALPTTAGVATTGLLEPTTSTTFFGVREVNPLLLLPYTITTTVRATSAAQPVYFQELTATTTVQLLPCGGVPAPAPAPGPAGPLPPAPAQPAASCLTLTGSAIGTQNSVTMVKYYPGNPSQPGDTLSQQGMPVVRDAGGAPAAGSLYNYSTDLHTAAGRSLDPATTGNPNRNLASWTYGMPATSQLKGEGELTFWAGPVTTSATATTTFTVTLARRTSAGTLIETLRTANYTTPAAAWSCAGLRPMSVKVFDSSSGTTVNANEQLHLSIAIASGAPVRLGYGTAAYPMTLTLPYKTGLG